MINWIMSSEWTQVFTLAPTSLIINVSIIWLGQRLSRGKSING